MPVISSSNVGYGYQVWPDRGDRMLRGQYALTYYSGYENQFLLYKTYSGNIVAVSELSDNIDTTNYENFNCKILPSGTRMSLVT